MQKRQEGGGKSLPLPNPTECRKKMKGGKSRSPREMLERFSFVLRLADLL